MRRGSETFLKAIFGKSNEQKEEPAWGWLCDAHRQLNGEEARDCLVFFFFLSRRMILELQKEDQTWLRGERCPEGVRGERKGPNLTECSLGPWRREAAPPSQKTWVGILPLPHILASLWVSVSTLIYLFNARQLCLKRRWR